MASSQSAANLPAGAARPQDSVGKYNNISFAIQQALALMQTVTLVRVVSCTNAGELSPVGYVDVVPLVQQIDSQGVPVPHTTIFNVPYLRIQGGANAVIIDPQTGDLGIAVFASRDITKVKISKTEGPPGSFRKFDFGDALYLGGVLNGEPSQYIRFSSTGIKIHSPTTVTIDAPDVSITCDSLAISASTSVVVDTPVATFSGDIVVSGKSFLGHVHGNVANGPSNTGTPV